MIKLGIKARQQQLKELTPAILQDFDNGLNWEGIIVKYKTSNPTFTRILKENGRIPRNAVIKDSLKHDYFEKIDSHIKAYFLGLLHADGCNTESIGKISLILTEPDLYIIEKLKTEINHIGKITKFQPQKKNHKKACHLRWTSRKMSDDLKKLEMVQRKSLILKFPTEEQVPKEFLISFILGYFDGDGACCFSRKNNRFRLTVDFCCSIIFGAKLNEIFNNDFNIKSSYFIKKDQKTSSVRIHRQEDVLKIFNLFYTNRDFYMIRKYDKFIEFFNWKKECIKNNIYRSNTDYLYI